MYAVSDLGLQECSGCCTESSCNEKVRFTLYTISLPASPTAREHHCNMIWSLPLRLNCRLLVDLGRGTRLYISLSLTYVHVYGLFGGH